MKQIMKTDIKTNNNKGQLHGYQEYYHKNSILTRFNYKNNKLIGYEEWHYFKETNFYIR